VLTEPEQALQIRADPLDATLCIGQIYHREMADAFVHTEYVAMKCRHIALYTHTVTEFSALIASVHFRN